MKFTIAARDPGSLARAGLIETAHGAIETPAFIPVGTKATVKSLTADTVRDDVGAHAVLANTYHLYLEPGPNILRKAGGLGRFMDWAGPTFTDSGGFQAFSLGSSKGRAAKIVGNEKDIVPSEAEEDTSTHESLARVDDDGVTFRSIIDGSEHRFTPERSIEIQHDIGADIIFAFDECLSPHETYERQKGAIERTRLWAERCLIEHKKQGKEGREKGRVMSPEALFGIVQGGRHEDLRKLSAHDIGSMALEDGTTFDGFGIGGSFDKDDIGTAVRWVCTELPEGKPRHLLGIGEPRDLILGIDNGIDTFDCVAPTRMARNGGAYVAVSTDAPRGRLNLLNAKFVEDFGLLDPDCACSTCKKYSRAYIAHLFRAQEMLAATLLSVHNLFYLVDLTKRARKAIVEGKWQEFKSPWVCTLPAHD